jgi:oligosaccharide repeat unit polymerase
VSSVMTEPDDAVGNESAGQPAVRSRPSVLALTVLGSASILLTGIVWFWPQDRPPFGPGTCLALAVVLLIVHLVGIGRRLGSFDPGMWVPVLIILHSFGMVVAVEMIPDSGYFDYDPYGKGVPRVEQGFALALLTQVLFMFGFHLFPMRSMRGQPPPPGEASSSVRLASHALLWGGALMIIIGIPVAGVGLVFGHYGEAKEAAKFAEEDFRLIGAGYLFATAGIYGLIASARSHWDSSFLSAAGASLLLLIFLFLTGDRTGMSVLAFAGGWAYTQRLQRVPTWFVVTGFIVMFLFMPIVKEYRTWRNVDESTRAPISSLAAITFYEMGSTVQVYSYTLEEIPKNKDYDWGMSVVAQFVNIIPNFGTTAGRRFMSFDPLDHDPSKWVTWAANPSKYFRSGGGYGYAVGAEWYFNLGMPGVFFGMILMGVMTGYFRDRVHRSTMWMISSAIMFGFMVGVVRNDVGYPMRTALWPLAGYAIMVPIFNRFLGRRSGPREPLQTFDPTNSVGRL